MAKSTATVVLGDRIASGRTADIYEFGEKQVVKLFREWVREEDVLAEREKAALALSVEIATPAVGELVRFQERIGLVFERVEGDSMLSLFDPASNNLEAVARQFAEWHRNLNAHTSPTGLPPQQDVLASRISRNRLLGDRVRRDLLEALTRLVHGDRLCHGDFHPGNILLSSEGPVVIDWNDASRGNPLADVARTSILLAGHLETASVTKWEHEALSSFHRIYLAHRLGQESGNWNEFRQWLPIMAAVRLTEGVEEQQEWLLLQARKRPHAGAEGTI